MMLDFISLGGTIYSPFIDRYNTHSFIVHSFDMKRVSVWKKYGL